MAGQRALSAIPSFPTTHRRGLLAGAAAALVAGVVAAVPMPADASGDDAELIADCREFMAAEAEMRSWDRGEHPQYSEDDAGEAAVNRIHDRWHAAAWRIVYIPATTQAGRLAKAEVALVAMLSTEEPGGTYNGVEETLAVSLLADLTGRDVEMPDDPRAERYGV